MANYINKIRTADGDLQIDYEALANLPVANKSAFDAMMSQKQNASTAITQSNIITYLQDKTVAKAENANKLEGFYAKEFAKSDHTHDNYVPTSRKINGIELSWDVNLGADNIGAAKKDHEHYYASSSTPGGAASSVANPLKILAGGLNEIGGHQAHSITYDGSMEISLDLALREHKHWDLDIIDVVAIDKGGTGADNASDALSNLGGFPAQQEVDQTLGYNLWYQTYNGDVEYINPGHFLGSTDRSIERFLGFPVYVAVCYLGELPNNSTKKHTLRSGISNIVDCRVFAKNSSTGVYAQLPWFNDDEGKIIAKAGINLSSNELYVKTFADVSKYVGYAVIKYTDSNAISL